MHITLELLKMHVIFVNSEFITINLPCDNAARADFQRKINSLSRAAKTPPKRYQKAIESSK